MKNVIVSLLILSLVFAISLSDGVTIPDPPESAKFALSEQATASLPVHECRFDDCPYQGLYEFAGVIHEYGEPVDTEYEGTDSYYIDKLHWEFPECNYDELEDRLLKSNCPVCGGDGEILCLPHSTDN